MRTWRGEDLPGKWLVTRKLDGVCVIITNKGQAVSRAGKALYNVPPLEPGIYECYAGSWANSISAVRTQNAAQVDRSAFYLLARYGKACIDARLILSTSSDISSSTLRRLLHERVSQGDEGLVLHNKSGYVKVKPRVTHDVKVIGIQPGTGKHTGKMGAVITPMGKVGTGFTDEQRKYFAHIPSSDKPLIIEVECMGLTPDGKFRHPRFLRIRWDK